MTPLPPGLLFGLLLSTIYAALFHLWGGRSVRDLLVYVAAAAAGFAVGQFLGMLMQLPLPRIGQVHIIEASVFAWLALISVRQFGLGQRTASP